jgi:hypothetical protein
MVDHKPGPGILKVIGLSANPDRNDGMLSTRRGEKQIDLPTLAWHGSLFGVGLPLPA